MQHLLSFLKILWIYHRYIGSQIQTFSISNKIFRIPNWAMAWSWRCSCVVLVAVMLLAHMASAGSIVKNLPGYNDDLPFKLETGTVGAEFEDLNVKYREAEKEVNMLQRKIQEVNSSLSLRYGHVSQYKK